jgi:hypothetical protein
MFKGDRETSDEVSLDQGEDSPKDLVLEHQFITVEHCLSNMKEAKRI